MRLAFGGRQVHLYCKLCGLWSNSFEGKTVQAAFTLMHELSIQRVDTIMCPHRIVARYAVARPDQGGIRAAVVRMAPAPQYIELWDSRDPSVYATFEFNERMDRVAGFEKRAEKINRVLFAQRRNNLYYLHTKQALLEKLISGQDVSWIEDNYGREIADMSAEEQKRRKIKRVQEQISIATKNEEKFQRDEVRVRLLRLALKENAVEWRPADVSAEKPQVREYAFRPATVYDVTNVRAQLVIGDGDVFPAKFADVVVLQGEKP